MKVKIFTILVILFAFVCQVSAESVWIDNVNVIPNQPSDIDSIIFNISGHAEHLPFPFTYDQFTQNETSLQLDLHFNGGGYGFDVIIPWTYSKQIQALSPATYNLEVRTFDDYYGTLQDTYTTDFIVTPEPCTVVLFGIGLPILRAFSKRKL